MAIAVGELLVAIQADDTPLKQALAEVDRLSKGYADRSVSYQKAVNEARKQNTAAQTALNAEQRKYNTLLEKAQKAKQEGKKLSAAEFQKLRQTSERLEKLRATAAGTSSALEGAVRVRDENKMAMARAREQVKAVRFVAKAEKDAAKARDQENKLTENEYVGKKKMRAAANRDIDNQRKAALKEEREAEKRIEAERERYRKLERNQRRSAINNHIAELQRREAHEIEADKRVHGERERLRKRELASRKVAFAQLLDEKYGPVNQKPQQQMPALPPGMKLRGGQLAPIVSPSRQPVQGPALPPGMALRGGRLVPIVTPPRMPRMPRMSQRQSFLSSGQGGMFGGLGLGTIAATAGVAQLVRTANDLQVVQQRLAQVSSNGGEAKLAFDKLSESAQRLRQPISETVELYTKLRQSNDRVGLSANQTIQVTEAFSAALRISGATGQAAASALLQFGQAMAKGNLDGDEFRTVAENASEVLRVLERYLNQTGAGAKLFGKETRITRGEILKFREEGKLTSKLMSDALLWDLENLRKKASEFPPSLSQAMTSLKNSVLMAMTNTRDVRRSIDNIAEGIVNVSKFVQDNGPLITGFAKVALAVGSVTLAVKLLNGVMTMASKNPLFLAVQGLAALAATLKARSDAKNGVDYDPVDNAKTAAQANKAAVGYAKQVNDLSAKILAKEKEKAAMIETQRKALFPEFMIKQGAAGFDRDIAAMKKKREELTEALVQSAQREDAFRIMDLAGKIAPTDPDEKPRKGKAIDPEKELDDEIKKLLELYEAELLTEDGLARLTGIRDEAQSVVNRLGDATSRTTEEDDKLLAANRRLVAIKEVLHPLVELENENIKEQASLVDTLNDNYDNLSKTLQKVADDLTRKQLKNTVSELHETQKAFMAAIAQLDAKSAQSLLQKIAELQAEIATLQQKLAERDSEGMGTGDKPTKGEKEPTGEGMLDRFIRRTKQGLLSLGLETPGDAVEAMFTAMASKAEDGGNTVAEKMRAAFAKISMAAGKKLIDLGFAKLAKEYGAAFKAMIGKMIAAMAGSTTVLGKFITKIKVALSNPLIAGPALVAIGIAMAAYAAKMGAIGRGESGGDIGATIGGLSIGGQDKPLRYTFADRRNPLEGSRIVGTPQQSIMVNQTIIGANDPVAQRQIVALIDNAARRGIGNGSSLRT
jgi:tape measure domain-containing protein